MLPVIDEYTRKCRAIQLRRRLAARDIQECLTGLFCSQFADQELRL